jgi:hypothetical protein
MSGPQTFLVPPRCGIYHLVKEGRVLYVGQSVNVMTRVGAWLTARLEFDAWHVYACAVGELNDLEREHIQRFDPPLNRGGRTWQFTNVPRLPRIELFDDMPEAIGATDLQRVGLYLKTPELLALPGFPAPIGRRHGHLKWGRNQVRAWMRRNGLPEPAQRRRKLEPA